MTQKTLQPHLESILQLARLAPSVHNTQPWKVRAHDDSLEVTIDNEHTLLHGDPTGRQTIISMGIFTEAIILAAGHYGFNARNVKYANKHAEIDFESANESFSSSSLIAALQSRCSDRSIYTPVDLSAFDLDKIQTCYRTPNVTVHIATDGAIRQRVAELTGRAISVALSSPNFRNELAEYLRLPWSTKQRGISVLSLHIPWPFAILEPLFLRLGINISAEAKLEKKRWDSASGLVVITAEGDMPKHWFEAGRTYLYASLAIEELGLSQATSAAIVEASNYHEDIEELLGTKQRILAVLRFGKGSPTKRFSPRVNPDELLTSN
jgi:hypothetical protein